jgi:hypothetical protein
MGLLRWLRRSVPRKPAPPRRTLTVESLEDRSLPSGITFQFTLNDPGNEFAAFPLLQTDLNAAGQILSGILNGRGTILVRVSADNSIPRSEGAPLGTVFVRNQGGRAVYETAALAEAQTGVDPLGAGQPEIDIDLNTQSYLPQAWFDPSGAARAGTVPSGKTDFISIILHEMTHGFGFTGWRAISGSSYGQLPAGYESAYDALTRFGTGGNPNVLYFDGPEAEAVYGGPVPLTSVGPSNALTSQNFYHVGNPAGLPGTDLVSDIMNGMVFYTGTRYTLGPLDQAMLADMGWSVHGALPAAVPLLTGDVTGLVLVVLGRPQRNRRTHHYQRTVSLQNVSAQAIQGPLTLLLLPSRGEFRLHAVHPVAKTIEIGELDPGATLTVALPWSGPNAPAAIRVLAG